MAKHLPSSGALDSTRSVGSRRGAGRQAGRQAGRECKVYILVFKDRGL